MHYRAAGRGGGYISLLARRHDWKIYRQANSAEIQAGKLLALCAIMAALLVSVSVLTNSHVAMWSILAVGLFSSIMFPCIFTLGIAELGPLTGDGSGILNMAIVGGAISMAGWQSWRPYQSRLLPAMTARAETSWVRAFTTHLWWW
jgi:hypothetical protein